MNVLCIKWCDQHYPDHFYCPSLQCTDGIIICAKLLLAFPFAISDKLFCVNAIAFQGCTTSVPFCSRDVSNTLFDVSSDSVRRTDTSYHSATEATSVWKFCPKLFDILPPHAVFGVFALIFPIRVAFSTDLFIYLFLYLLICILDWYCAFMPATDEKGAPVAHS